MEENIKKEIENKIRKQYKDRKWDNRVTDIIVEFIIKFEDYFTDKYTTRIIERLKELKEIRYEFNDSKYKASSKDTFIVFFKDIKDDKQFKYILEHELFHFIQKEQSVFEDIPIMYKNVLDNNIKIFLLEEAFVQYFTAIINDKTPEYIIEDKDKTTKKYWLNECYKEIVGYVEELEEKIGTQNLIDMYMDDNRYYEEIEKFDNKYGKNEFAKYIKLICDNPD